MLKYSIYNIQKFIAITSLLQKKIKIKHYIKTWKTYMNMTDYKIT